VCGANEQCAADGQCVPKVLTPKTAALVPAEPAPAPAAAPSSPDIDTSPESTKPGVRTHDGFYFRVALGPNFVSSTWKGGSSDATISGVGPALELAFGGTIARGFVLGGGIYSGTAPSPTFSNNGTSFDIGTTSSVLVGPFADWYPDPNGGFHVQGAVGFGYASFESKDSSFSVSGVGPGFMAGLGYELWVGEQWSLGALARLTYSTPSVKDDKNNIQGSLDTTNIVPALLINATYH
jgi:hypothetical protein